MSSGTNDVINNSAAAPIFLSGLLSLSVMTFSGIALGFGIAHSNYATIIISSVFSFISASICSCIAIFIGCACFNVSDRFSRITRDHEAHHHSVGAPPFVFVTPPLQPQFPQLIATPVEGQAPFFYAIASPDNRRVQVPLSSELRPG